ncbi:MAG TPA: class I SAM-dependent methyltransferase [Candidatus Lokiarchaeia archaeon]|nr:class I SAM-dependent methyltransferase [Candidatus Lokiarchaeia archaeon]
MSGEDGAHEHRHEHGGQSTRGLIDPKKLLQKVGVKQGDVMLDVGCGDGFISIEAAKDFVGPSGMVHATDVDPSAIAKVTKQIDELGLKNIDATEADATKAILLDDHVVDTCIIANVLHGFVVNREIDGIFSELLRVMKPGGKVAIIEFKKSKRFPGPPYEDRLAPADVEAMFDQHGSTRIATFNPGVLHYARVFQITA